MRCGCRCRWCCRRCRLRRLGRGWRRCRFRNDQQKKVNKSLLNSLVTGAAVVVVWLGVVVVEVTEDVVGVVVAAVVVVEELEIVGLTVKNCLFLISNSFPAMANAAVAKKLAVMTALTFITTVCLFVTLQSKFSSLLKSIC